MSLPAAKFDLIIKPPFDHCGGFMWKAVLPPDFMKSSDMNGAPRASRLQLYEDEVPLGPAHTVHEDIVAKGRSRYSHWENALWFATSDGTDPNANDRCYSLTSIGTPALKLLGLGGCHLHAALADLDSRDFAQRLWKDPGISYTPRETQQLIEFHLGQLEIPESLHALALSTPPGRNTFPTVVSNAEAVIIEFGSCIDILYSSFLIMRSNLVDFLITPICALGVAETRIAKRWYQQGLLNQDEEIRQASTSLLLPLISRLDIDQSLARDVIENARGCRQDGEASESTLGKIRNMLNGKAICVMSAYNIFTPDGRPVTWPGNFARDLERICRNMRIPLLQPSLLVAKHGAAFSLKTDLHHYTPAFLTVLGDEILAIARRALDGCEDLPTTDTMALPVDN